MGDIPAGLDVSNLNNLPQLLQEYLVPHYARHDTMHDESHINRLSRRARSLAMKWPCNLEILSLAVLLHGVVNDHGSGIRAFLIEQGMPPGQIDHIFLVALESEKDSMPSTPEGKILHDAHLLEGDENFLITKSLVTGSARGQSLAETIQYFQEHLGIYRCAIPENQPEFERREQLARDYLTKLGPEV